jgi:hypothetical protein
MTFKYTNPLDMARRWLDNRAFARQLDRNLAARRAARASGRVYVAGYTRRKA